jgi:hypothetical protein
VRNVVIYLLAITGLAIIIGCEAFSPPPPIDDIPITSSCSRPPVYGIYAGPDGNLISAGYDGRPE